MRREPEPERRSRPTPFARRVHARGCGGSRRAGQRFSCCVAIVRAGVTPRERPVSEGAGHPPHHRPGGLAPHHIGRPDAGHGAGVGDGGGSRDRGPGTRPGPGGARPGGHQRSARRNRAPARLARGLRRVRAERGTGPTAGAAHPGRPQSRSACACEHSAPSTPAGSLRTGCRAWPAGGTAGFCPRPAGRMRLHQLAPELPVPAAAWFSGTRGRPPTGSPLSRRSYRIAPASRRRGARCQEGGSPGPWQDTLKCDLCC